MAMVTLIKKTCNWDDSQFQKSVIIMTGSTRVQAAGSTRGQAEMLLEYLRVIYLAGNSKLTVTLYPE